MTKVRIRNFQSIGDINLEIDGFTVVVGKSDIGKSAVIRAIDAALSNQSGDAFIKHGQVRTTVNINYQETEIEWKKGDTSSYKINGESFTKLNRAIPKPLMDAGFSKVEIGDQKISPLVASQFEPIFLLDKPGSVITEVLSKLYKLNVLSSADDKCQKELKSNKSLLKTRELDITGLKEKLKSYDGFEDIKESIKVLANMEKESISLKKTISEIESYELLLKSTSEKYKKLSSITSVNIPETQSLSDSIETVTWISEKSDTLQELIKSVKSLKNSSTIDIPIYDIANSSIEELKQITLWDSIINNSNSTIKKMESMPSFENLLKSSEEIGETSKLVSSIIEMEKELTSVATSAKSARDELRKIETELISATEEEKKEKELLGGLCPVCGKSL
jgi:DNA repair ATPase RecN/Zn finger protein HypA/HybF involved in hydrogenase expression